MSKIAWKRNCFDYSCTSIGPVEVYPWLWLNYSTKAYDKTTASCIFSLLLLVLNWSHPKYLCVHCVYWSRVSLVQILKITYQICFGGIHFYRPNLTRWTNKILSSPGRYVPLLWVWRLIVNLLIHYLRLGINNLKLLSWAWFYLFFPF